MAGLLIHAPDGGMMGYPLCQSKEGDTTDYEQDVDCPECLDELEAAGQELIDRLLKNGFEFTGS